ncbi:hypothetical protein B566_EDAN004516 [Ephemera danica]|nr:hypothetical protein B566_EDAN004516 [Ephemera danica]
MVLCLKKRWLGDELLTLALLLSLLRPEGLEHHSVGLPVTSSGLELALQSSRRGYGELGLLAPGARGRAKTLLLDPQQYQQELLEELLALGRFDHYNNWRPRS